MATTFFTLFCPDCSRKLEVGDWPTCRGDGNHALSTARDAQLHESEKVVIYENDKGETVLPGRADQPMHPKYAALGYKRKTLDTIAQVRDYERRTNTRMLRLHYDANSAREDRDLGCR